MGIEINLKCKVWLHHQHTKMENCYSRNCTILLVQKRLKNVEVQF